MYAQNIKSIHFPSSRAQSQSFVITELLRKYVWKVCPYLLKDFYDPNKFFFLIVSMLTVPLVS